MPKHVHRKRAKGRVYYYFDTGARVDGRAVLKRLPDLRDITFGPAYTAALRHRNNAPAKVVTATTLAELADLWERSPVFKAKAKGTREIYALYLTTIVNALGMAPAEDVQRADVVKLIDTMADRPGAANMVLAVIASLYGWARQRGHVTAHPTRDVEPFKLGEHEPWPEPLVEAALICDKPLVRTAVALLYYTAQRIGDVCRMRWTDIRGEVLHVRQQKTARGLEIPVHAELRRILGSPAGLGPILQHDGRAYHTDTIRDHIQRWASERGHDIVPHGLRKNAVNALLEAGCSAAETAAISGQTLQLVEHYAKRRNTAKLAGAAILKWEGTKRVSEN